MADMKQEDKEIYPSPNGTEGGRRRSSLASVNLNKNLDAK